MRFREKFEDLADILRTDVLMRYNVVKAVLLVLLIVFIAVLLGGNAGSQKSAEAMARSVVPELVQESQDGESGEEAPETEGENSESGENSGDGGENTTGSEEGEGEATDPSSGEETGVFDGMGQATALDFKRIFGLNAEDYEGVAYFKPISQMEELLIVKLASSEQEEALEEAVEERIDNQKTSFDGYGVAQCALLEKAIVKTKGNFLFYCVSPDAEQHYQAFLDAM